MASSKEQCNKGEANSTTNKKSLEAERNVNPTKKQLDSDPQDSSRSTSYTLYVATCIAALGAFCSVTQFDLCCFMEEFSASLCNTSLVDQLSKTSNETTTFDVGLSSIFDPILNVDEKYDALSAIKSR